MAYSLMRIISDGTLSTIVLTFPFFDKSHVVVSVGPAELPGGGYTWAWLNSNTIKITPAVTAGVEVVVRRRTPYGDMLNIYDAGAVFDEFTMDENFRQLLFSFQEALESNKSTDVYNDLNIHGYRVTNIGNAVTGRDALPYAQYQADTQGAYQQRLAAESAATTATTKAAEATSAATTAASNAVAAANALIVQTAETAARALLGFRNILINGEVTRINQRAFDGNWTPVAVGSYGYDRWKKADATNMQQIVEAGNFVPGATYTLSGTGVTTTTFQAPASGNMTITVPMTARLVQVELGSKVSPFEYRSYGLELALCQRYFERGYTINIGYVGAAAGQPLSTIVFKVPKRVTPTTALTSITYANCSAATIAENSLECAWPQCTGAGAGAAYIKATYSANAEL